MTLGRPCRVIRTAAGREFVCMEIPERKSWKEDLATYLRPDRARSVGQIASVVAPYLGVWALAAIVLPNAWLAVGLVATVFLVRMLMMFVGPSLVSCSSAGSHSGACHAGFS
jgi:hypothetical protein